LKLLSLKLVIRKTVPNYENNYSLNNSIAVASNLYCASLFTKMSNLKNIPCHSLNKQKDLCLFVNTIASPVKLEMFHEWMNEFANLVVSTDSVAIVGEEFGCVRMQECRDIIASYYINKFSKGCSSPRFKMCIRLTETTLFHCAPRRLSYEVCSKSKVTFYFQEKLLIYLSILMLSPSK